MTPPGTKEPLDERKKGELKRWHKTQHSEDHGICIHHFLVNRRGKSRSSDFLFSWTPKSLQTMTAAMKLKDAYSLEEKIGQT